MEIVYCEGWAPDNRALVGRLAEAVARQRDERGEQYAVALVGDGGAPAAVLEIAWARRFARTWRLNEQGRPVRVSEYRRLPEDRLFLLQVEEREYVGAEIRGHVERRNQRDGRSMVLVTKFGRGTRQTREQVPPEELTTAVPAFGDWLAMAGLDEAAPVRTAADPAESAPVAPPWRPPVPLEPFALAETFTPGTRFALGEQDDVDEQDQQDEVVVETHAVGTLRMPSGRLMVGDPTNVSGGNPITVTVAPGEYPADVSLARFVRSPDHVRPVALRLTVHPEPVASWEMALFPDCDPLFLSDGQMFGFGVDAGMACFVDADAAEALQEEAVEGEIYLDLDDQEFTEVTSPDTEANMVVCHSGWGDGVYPTWLGRTAAGEPAAFVIDFLVLHGGKVVS
jgi:uncharacterized protein DUF4241